MLLARKGRKERRISALAWHAMRDCFEMMVFFGMLQKQQLLQIHLSVRMTLRAPLPVRLAHRKVPL
jgi:hypothetical protein